jgi:hypothetical protein
MKLVFVYNADSGVISWFRDVSQKLMSPQAYDCFLCRLTHGTFREDSTWKAFRKTSSIEMEFLHRDEFEKKFKMKEAYPVVLQQNDELEVVLSRDQLAHLTSVDDLIVTVKGLALQND